MSSTQLIEQARALIESSQNEKALQILTAEYEANQTNVEFLQIFGEVLLENNDLETGYSVLVQACELDPHGDKGVEKFLYLGQMIGGVDGITSLEVGLAKLNNQLNLVQLDNGNHDKLLVELLKLYTSKQSLVNYLIKKLNQGIFAQIEIWMTDLCMEPEAETKCNELIDFSLKLDAKNPEALSLLASIRISQQRNDEAKDSLMKSWELFQIKKKTLEDAANDIKLKGDSGDENADSFEVGLEYVELIQPLLTLARFAIELELYDLAITISSNVQDINEDILDVYYYEALANLFCAKKLYWDQNNSKVDDYRDLDLSNLLNSKDETIVSRVNDAKSALTQGFKIINSNSVETADPELVDQVQALLSELGGPVMSELMPKRNEDETGWEDEIPSDED